VGPSEGNGYLFRMSLHGRGDNLKGCFAALNLVGYWSAHSEEGVMLLERSRDPLRGCTHPHARKVKSWRFAAREGK